jgi:tetratricopeptide (TPR) repeat protein
VLTGDEQNARLWDVATGELIGAPMEHGWAVVSASFSPDGRRVFTASSDGAVRLWDGGTGRLAAAPIRHKGELRRAEFSPNGRRMVTICDDGAARVWDVSSLEPLAPPMRHPAPVVSAAFSADGQRLITAGQDGTARVWDLRPDTRPRRDLLRFAQVFSRERRDPSTSEPGANLQTWHSTWQELRRQYPDEFSASAAEVAAWSAPDQRAQKPTTEQWRMKLATELFRRAVALRDRDQFLESEAVCRRALDAFRALKVENPQEMQFVDDIGWACHLLSDVLVRAGRFEEAAPLARESLTHFQALAEIWADRPEHRDAIAVAYGPLVYVLDGLNQPEEAAQARRDALTARQAAEELRTLPAAQELLDFARPFAETRDWTHAAAELNRGFEQQHRSDGFLCFSTALVRLLAGDVEGYARLAGGMPILNSLPPVRLDVLRTCTIHPRGATDPAALVRMARSAYDEDPNQWNAHDLGMAHYRAREFDQALRWIDEAWKLSGWHLYAPALAMTHHQLGHTDEARQWLDKANTNFRDFAPPSGDRLKTLQDDPYWQDWAYFEVMLIEARALLGEGEVLPPTVDADATSDSAPRTDN